MEAQSEENYDGPSIKTGLEKGNKEMKEGSGIANECPTDGDRENKNCSFKEVVSEVFHRIATLEGISKPREARRINYRNLGWLFIWVICRVGARPREGNIPTAYRLCFLLLLGFVVRVAGKIWSELFISFGGSVYNDRVLSAGTFFVSQFLAI